MQIVQDNMSSAPMLRDYLPALKEKLCAALKPETPVELLLINSAFMNYELYLVFLESDFCVPPEWEIKRKALLSMTPLQLASIAIYYRKLLIKIRQRSWLEADKKLLMEIFQYYRESMLHFKAQRKYYNCIEKLFQDLDLQLSKIHQSNK